MKLIYTSEKLHEIFLECLDKYNKYYWLIAWGGIDSEPFDTLAKNKLKIDKMIIGTHFYQTHPLFIKEFMGNLNVRFVKQPSGVFHPKVYLFENNSAEWTAIIGSANFTKSAFSSNSEVVVQIDNNDNNAVNVNYEIKQLIESTWNDSEYFDEGSYNAYESAWKKQQYKLRSLSGTYSGNKKKGKAIYDSEIVKMTWDNFVQRVKDDPYHGLKGRLYVLKIVSGYFNEHINFKDFTEKERKITAGIEKDKNENFDSRWFGSMIGSGTFKNRIINNDINISNALDQIPLVTNVLKSHYDAFLEQWKKSFPDGDWIATASRLLAMKRPDVFICLDSKNRAALSKSFGIKMSNMTYERYWGDIIEPIFDSEWWNNPSPKNAEESEISKARSTFLDALFYKPK